MSPSFTLETKQFQGPLEKLLDLIEARKMPISDVSLSDVCDAYLAYVEKLPELPLGETSQFILVASTLLLIKSRTLLPTLDLSEEERESVEELERRLARLATIRAAARGLQKEWGTSPLVFAKRPPARPVVFAAGEATITTIADAAFRILHSLPKPEKLAEAAVVPILALEDVIVSVRQRLARAIRTRFSDLTKNAADRHEVIVHFLAILELVRAGSASVSQERLFEDITIEIEQVTAPKYGTSY